MNLLIVAMIPVTMPLINIGSFNRKEIGLQTLNLILERNTMHCFDLNEYGRVFPIFSVQELTSDLEILIKISSSASIRRLLCISAQIDIPEYIENMNTDNGIPELINGNEAVEIHKSIIFPIFMKRIYDYAFALNLCGDNYICLNEGIIKFSDSNYVYRTNKLNPDFIVEAISKAEQMKWPKLRSIKIDQVIKWLNNQQGFLDGFGGGKIGRALNSIVNISFQRDTYSPESLFWAMVGLESIYTSGKSGLLEQVRDKSQILLGKQESFKKALNKMYDFRSRFVHGDLDFATPNYMYDSDELFKFHSDVSEALQIAVAVLICTIQELIVQDWEGVSFNYSVTNSHEVDQLHLT